MTKPGLSKRSTTIHYGWVILLTGVGVMCACLGLGRFALGMLLPSMGESLHLDYGQMGLISTANFTGYMVSVIFAGMVSSKIGSRLTITLGLFVVGISMTGIWAAEGLRTVLLLYVVTGIGSGLANIPMLGLVAGWFVKRWRGRAAGLMLVGNGLGIILSGFLVPQLNIHLGGQGWRFAWLTLGGIVFIITVLAGLLLRNSPGQMRQRPMGSSEPADSQGKTSETPAQTAGSRRDTVPNLIRLGLIYMLFGATYAVYATFIVTSLVNERGFSEHAAGTFWSAVGILSLFSGIYAGYVSDRLGRFPALVLVFSQFTAAHLLALTGLPTTCLYLSIAAFGLSIWGIPTIMAATVGDMVGPERASSAFGFITIFFGIGQVVGPAVAGYLAESTGLFDTAFLVCAALTALGAIASLRLGKYANLSA